MKTCSGADHSADPHMDFTTAGVVFRGPKHHISIRILHPGSKAEYDGDTANHGL